MKCSLDTAARRTLNSFFSKPSKMHLVTSYMTPTIYTFANNLSRVLNEYWSAKYCVTCNFIFSLRTGEENKKTILQKK
jgi:hypothetical protein